MMQKEFQVTLPSTSSKMYFPNNKSELYNTKLKTPLDLGEDYEVAIMNIQFPFNWTNIPETEMVFCIRTPNVHEPDFREMEKAFDALIPINREFEKAINRFIACGRNRITGTLPLRVPAAYYSTPEELNESVLNTVLRTTSVHQKFKLIAKFDNARKRVNFERENIDWFNIIATNPEIFKALGLEYEEFENIFIFDMSATRVQPIKLKKLELMYIYTDIIQWQQVGDIEAPLLGTVPVQGKLGDQLFWAFSPPYYIPLNQHKIDTIEIKIRDDYGEPIPFGSDSKIVCQLHFRRRRYTP